jgi:hypothetical protein
MSLKKPSSIVAGLLGFVLFAIGMTYAFLPHTLHQRMPILTQAPHTTHILIGCGIVFVSILLIALSDRIARK